MQLCALDDNDTLTFAYKALKQKGYRCLECNTAVRLRGGSQRQLHFYHTQPNRKCSLHAKGMPHLMVQYHLRDTLPAGEVDLECRFPSIGRIADVVWHTKKVIYEIQYSPISAEEVLERNKAYASLGYTVVWILHDARFNQTLVSPAEDALVNSTHYFTDMDEQGIGIIYDQFCCIKKKVRTHRFPKLTIDPSTTYAIRESQQDLDIPHQFNRRRAWQIGFGGDMLHRLLHNDDDLLRTIAHLPKDDDMGSLQYNLEGIRSCLRRWVIDPYNNLLRLLLERASR